MILHLLINFTISIFPYAMISAIVLQICVGWDESYIEYYWSSEMISSVLQAMGIWSNGQNSYVIHYRVLANSVFMCKLTMIEVGFWLFILLRIMFVCVFAGCCRWCSQSGTITCRTCSWVGRKCYRQWSTWSCTKLRCRQVLELITFVTLRSSMLISYLK